MTHFLDTPDGGFDYVIERRPRRRTVGIQVKSDGRVLVAAPPLVPHLFVKKFLRDKSAWVHRKLADVARLQHHKAARTYADGDSILYLGHNYTLRFAGSSRLDEANRVLHLGMRGDRTRRELVIAALTRWYKHQAKLVLTERTALLSGKIAIEPAQFIGIKSYRSRWGTCHSDGRIYFNWRLAMAPLDVVDYVAVHELCHLLHHNHSSAFWDEVARISPDYKEQRCWLRKRGQLLDV